MLRHSLHSVRPSHCPDSRNEQRKRPTLNDIYLIIYYHPKGRLLLRLILTIR